MNEDDAILWQDVLDEVAAGRTQTLKCPFCQKGDVAVEKIEQRMRVECRACHRFIEGRMAGAGE